MNATKLSELDPRIRPWMNWCLKWHLVGKEYRIVDKKGDWYYWTTRLGTVYFALEHTYDNLRELFRRENKCTDDGCTCDDERGHYPIHPGYR